MAGTLIANTINTDTGVYTSLNALTGAAKAWVNFNGVTTVSIRGSFNVSSVTRASTGTYTISFTATMADANYSVVASTSPAFGVAPLFVLTNTNGSEVANTTSSFSIVTQSTAAATDSKYVNIAVFGA